MNQHILVSASDISRALEAPARQGKNMVPPFDVLGEGHVPFRILEDSEVENTPEVHRDEGDLWYCLEGSATFVCGGELVDPVEVAGYNGRELSGSAIKDGETMQLNPGDWLWIPPGIPHQHSAPKPCRMVIVKMKA